MTPAEPRIALDDGVSVFALAAEGQGRLGLREVARASTVMASGQETTSLAHPTGLAAKAPHPNAGKLFIDFVLSKRGQDLIRGMSRIPDRIDTPPDQARFIDVSNPVFAPTEVLEDFERYAKMFHDIFGGR